MSPYSVSVETVDAHIVKDSEHRKPILRITLSGISIRTEWRLISRIVTNNDAKIVLLIKEIGKMRSDCSVLLIQDQKVLFNMKQSQVLAHLRQICCSDLSRETAMLEFLRTVPKKVTVGTTLSSRRIP